MSVRIQFAKVSLALWLCAIAAVPSFAQRAHPSPPPPSRPPAAAAPRNPNRPPQAQQKSRQDGLPQNNANRPGGQRPNNPNRPPAGYNRAQQKKFSDLSPADKQKVLENNKKYQSLTPYQRQEMKDRADAWKRLTPAQQDHIRKDVLPKWRQLPQDRRQAIRQKLRVLQNMPESARNQRLNDPEFTRGLNEEDRATLRDLSHLHVGGEPDPPGD